MLNNNDWLSTNIYIYIYIYIYLYAKITLKDKSSSDGQTMVMGKVNGHCHGQTSGSVNHCC